MHIQKTLEIFMKIAQLWQTWQLHWGPSMWTIDLNRTLMRLSYYECLMHVRFRSFVQMERPLLTQFGIHIVPF